MIVGVVQYKEEAELFKFRKLIVLSACAVLATGVVLFIIKVFMIAIIISSTIPIGQMCYGYFHSVPASVELAMRTWRRRRGGRSMRATFKTKLLW